VRIGGAAILPALALLGACGAGQQPPPLEVGSSAGVAIVANRPGTGERLRNAGMASGAIFVADGCLPVQAGSRRFTPVLPHGAALTAGGRRGVPLVEARRRLSRMSPA
jgi:hypothetical protein